MILVLVIDSIFASNNGTSISSRRFAEALVRHGHTVRVVTFDEQKKDGYDPETGFTLYLVPELIVPVVTRLAHLQKDVWAKPVRATLENAFQGADVVHIYNPWPLGKTARKIARAMGIPTLGAFHCQPENITYNIGLGWCRPAAHLVYVLLNLFFYRHFSQIHCPSKFIAVQLRKHGYRQWLHVISNGVHPDFKPAGEAGPEEPAKRIDTAEQPNTRAPYRILMVGRLSPEKRQDVLIRAAALSRHAADIQLIFAGCGPREQKLKAMGERLPRRPEFCFLDKPDLIRLMRSCDLYVHASDVEIEGISCLEAISCGLVPVISDSRMSATAQFALSPDHLFPSGNPQALAQRIDDWLDHPQELEAARQEYRRFIRPYDLDNSIHRIESVYDRLTKSRENDNPYLDGRVFRGLSRFFYTVVAIPLLYVWSRAVLGTKIHGARNMRGLHGSLTVCNHVHSLDSVLVALAAFPRKMVFPTLPANLNKLWPGKIIRLLGGVAIQSKPGQLRIFMDEMEYQLRMGRTVHFFPEGELSAYAPGLRPFKNGAFRLAAQARVPIVPMSITFDEPRGLRKILQKRPVMTLWIDKPIYPLIRDDRSDADIRREKTIERMRSMMDERKTG